MISDLSVKVTGVLLNNRIIEKQDEEVYQYGLELLISTIINFTLVFFIGIIYGRFLQTVLFLLEYCFIRRYAGGYHANTHGKCIGTFSILYFLMLFLTKMFHIDRINVFLFLASMISNIIVFILSPVEDKNKPLEEQEIKRNSSISKKLIIISCIFNTILYLYIGNHYHLILFALYAKIWIGAVVIAGYIKNKYIMTKSL